MSTIDNWKPTASGNNASPPNGFPELMTRAFVNDSSREVMAAVKVYYDAPDFRNPFKSFTLVRTSGTSWNYQDAGGQTNANQYLEVGQKIKVVNSANPTVDFWEGFVETVAAYGAPNSLFTTSWIAAESKDIVGPTTATNMVFTVSFKELGRAAWSDTGTAAGQIPTADLIKPYALATNENALNVGQLNSITATRIMEAAARGRLNANGGLNVWQRGTSFTNVGTFVNNADAMTADNWTLISNGNNIVTVAQDTDVPATIPVRYSLKCTQVGAGNVQSGVATWVELDDGLDVSKPGGSGVVGSLSFWAKFGSVGGFDAMRCIIVNLRTATPTLSPILSWAVGAQTVNAAEYDLVSNTTFTITNTWQQFKVENLNLTTAFGIGAFGLCFISDDPVIGATANWHITGVQMNRGAVALPFLNAPIATELERCYRYHENTFDWQAGIFPVANAGANHALSFRSQKNTNSIVIPWRYRTAKYKAPTTATYNPNLAANTGFGDGAAANIAVASTTGNREGCQFISGATGNTDTTYSIGAHVSANIWGTG